MIFKGFIDDKGEKTKNNFSKTQLRKYLKSNKKIDTS